ncbi:hypothetical protein P692DRAFT_20748217 [Suillus brevipes Sb2]|nr:hypothetical protein P692DRAFT_20748217 [Suillus brevipes Sb2]
MEIILGIGLWHVHGHQDKCFVRYASNFILGVARIDGEIMETLWAPLNIISPSAWGMFTPHQQECLDFHQSPPGRQGSAIQNHRPARQISSHHHPSLVAGALSGTHHQS